MTAMCPEIVEARPLGGYRLHLRFSDGIAGEVDVAELVRFDGVFAPFATPGFFERVRVDEIWGTVCWPGGLDLAPEPLYERIVERSTVAAAETR